MLSERRISRAMKLYPGVIIIRFRFISVRSLSDNVAGCDSNLHYQLERQHPNRTVYLINS